MTFVTFVNFMSWVNAHLGAINQEKVLVGETVIVKTDGSFAALLYTRSAVFTQCSLFTVTRSINTIPS